MIDFIIQELQSIVGIAQFREDKYKDSYLVDYKENLNLNGKDDLIDKHLNRFKKANGGELNGYRYPAKMSAIRSSSAFAINLFGNVEDVVIPYGSLFPKGKYELAYEEKGLTIITKGRRHEANIDVCLRNSNCNIFVEVKLLEPLSFRNKDNSSYTVPENYSSLPTQVVAAFCEVFTESQNTEIGAFDACQMFKHLLGILHIEENLHEKTIYLVNCHWAFERFYFEGMSKRNKSNLLRKIRQYERTKEWYLEKMYFLKKVIEKAGLIKKLEVLNLNHFEMLKALGKENDSYMQRYDLNNSGFFFTKKGFTRR